MEQKKIFFISAANSIHTVKWVNSLSEKYEVHLIYCNNHKPKMDVINNKVILHRLQFNAPFGYYLNVIQLKKLYKKIKPDIVNVHYASGYGTLARISKLNNILLSVWGSDVYEFPNQSKFKKKILKKNVNYAKYLASTSNVMAEELRRQVNISNKEIYITPFGVDINKFYNYDLKRNDKNINIGTIKALEEKYGIKYVILAVKKVKNDLIKEGKKQLANSIKYYIYGDGREKETLLKLIKNEELEKDIFLMGKIPNESVPKKLNKLDIFCVTSLNNESFGVAVVEAMACEVPVVATNADGFKEVMDNNVTGYIVEGKDINSIADALKKLITSSETREIMGKNGRKRVIENYNWNKNVGFMEDIYEKILKDNERKNKK